MPMIDVYAPAGLIPGTEHRALAEALIGALLRAENAPAREPYLGNTAAYLHELPASSVHTGSSDQARVVRVQVVTPPGALDRAGQQQIVAEATELVAKHAAAGAPTTWVILTEAAEGGWGVGGRALGRAEFAALR